MNHKKHSRSFSVFYRNSAILNINIEFVYSHKKILLCIIGKTNRDEIQNQMRLKFARKLQKRNVTEKSRRKQEEWMVCNYEEQRQQNLFEQVGGGE